MVNEVKFVLCWVYYILGLHLFYTVFYTSQTKNFSKCELRTPLQVLFGLILVRVEHGILHCTGHGFCGDACSWAGHLSTMLHERAEPALFSCCWQVEPTPPFRTLWVMHRFFAFTFSVCLAYNICLCCMKALAVLMGRWYFCSMCWHSCTVAAHIWVSYWFLFLMPSSKELKASVEIDLWPNCMWFDVCSRQLPWNGK